MILLDHGGRLHTIFHIQVPASFAITKCSFLNSVFGCSLFSQSLTSLLFSRIFFLSSSFFTTGLQGIYFLSLFYLKGCILPRPLIRTCQTPSFDLPISQCYDPLGCRPGLSTCSPRMDLLFLLEVNSIWYYMCSVPAETSSYPPFLYPVLS